MKTLIDHLAGYAAYHRDPRNLVTHFIGIPMIVFAVAVLLSRPGLSLGGLWVSPAMLAAGLAAVFYLRLDVRYGLVMSGLLALCLWGGALLAVGATASWLAVGVGLFALGWVIQFIGHHYEGRKPAFLDDLRGLIVGPLFVVAEAGFLIGLRDEVRFAIEARSGGLRRRPVQA
ncbi:hypothetical protein DN824_02165 [Stutzerimonas nosocomialis]|uniref:Mpo1 family 2-hydroxy fatty acid dioxygenase n=1 Tax=Stutzerimonas nosocomialis TaxID=1056496 RepID=UPI0011081130|nr:Mpo1-like protein [Stutzerimonas nosocomialis]TLX61124.1 hypothetical protein DN824_02165 [Stutzerimonas nosocomialis]